MPKTLAKSAGYRALVRKIQAELLELDFFVKRRTAETYWRVGKYIHEHILESKDRADYGHHLFEDLGKDVERDKTTLRKILQFYRAYPIGAARRQLSWSHYKALMTVRDKEERERLEEEIIAKNWDTDRLQRYISTRRELGTGTDDHKPVPQLKFTRGKLHTCRIVPANKAWPSTIALAMDFGFREQYKIPAEAPPLKENDTVELVFRQGRLSGVRKVTVTRDELFTYMAMVERVIDGDTLLVSFDFKCPMSVSQKLRLRGIDCPEMDTEEGKRAKRFVEARLKDCDFIVVKTYKDRSDKFDRYLADIFYQAGASDPAVVAQEGTYLNQELLDERLAVMYE